MGLIQNPDALELIEHLHEVSESQEPEVRAISGPVVVTFICGKVPLSEGVGWAMVA